MANYTFNKVRTSKTDTVYAVPTPADYEGKTLIKIGWSGKGLPFGIGSDQKAIGNIRGEMGTQFMAYCRAMDDAVPASTITGSSSINIEAIRKEAFEAGKKEMLSLLKAKVEAKMAEAETLKVRVTELEEALKEAEAANDALLEQIAEMQSVLTKEETTEEIGSEIDAELEAFMAQLDEPTVAPAPVSVPAPTSAPVPATDLSADALSMMQQLTGTAPAVEEGTYYSSDEDYVPPMDDFEDCSDSYDEEYTDEASVVDLDKVMSFMDNTFNDSKVEEETEVAEEVHPYAEYINLRTGVTQEMADKMLAAGITPDKLEEVSRDPLLLADIGFTEEEIGSVIMTHARIKSGARF